MFLHSGKFASSQKLWIYKAVFSRTWACSLLFGTNAIRCLWDFPESWALSFPCPLDPYLAQICSCTEPISCFMLWPTYFLFRFVLGLRSAIERNIDFLLDVHYIPPSLCSGLLRLLLSSWRFLNAGMTALHDILQNDPRTSTMLWIPRVTFYPPTRA